MTHDAVDKATEQHYYSVSEAHHYKSDFPTMNATLRRKDGTPVATVDLVTERNRHGIGLSTITTWHDGRPLSKTYSEVTRLQAETERLRACLAGTAHVLHLLWRCDTDEERQELGLRVAEKLEKYDRHPSKIEVTT